MSQPGSRWERLWRGPRRWWWLGLPLGGVLSLLVGFGSALGFVGFVEYSNTQSFCLSCHEMRAFVYTEFQESVHFRTRSGVGPVCADCHVPGPWIPKMLRKVKATFKEVPSHVLGKIDTPEKFEAHRLAMAESVWKDMRKTDSRECRACHQIERMNIEAQSRWAQRKHSDEVMAREGQTCIDCHQGVAHRLPVMDDAAPES